MDLVDRLIDTVALYHEIGRSIQSSSELRAIAFGVIGALIGSFLNVIIYRLPIIMKQQALSDVLEYFPTVVNKKKLDSFISFENLHRRSAAPCCGVHIKWYENFPILSWLALKGQCANCSSKINVRYISLELGFAITSGLLGFLIPNIHVLLLTISLTAVLVGIAVIDLKHHLIFDGMVFFVFIVMLMAIENSSIFGSQTITSGLAQAFLFFLLFNGLNVISFSWKGNYAIGGGDIKLLSAVSVGFGFLPTVMIFGLSLFGFLVLHKAFKRVSGEEAIGHFLCTLILGYWLILVI